MNGAVLCCTGGTPRRGHCSAPHRPLREGGRSSSSLTIASGEGGHDRVVDEPTPVIFFDGGQQAETAVTRAQPGSWHSAGPSRDELAGAPATPHLPRGDCILVPDQRQRQRCR